MQTYYVWITALTNSHAEQLTGRLVSHGWVIGNLGKDLLYEHDTRIGCLVAFSMVRKIQPKGAIDKNMVLDELRETMRLLDMRYFSIIVTHAAECTWANSVVFRAIEGTDQKDDNTSETDESNPDRIVH